MIATSRESIPRAMSETGDPPALRWWHGAFIAALMAFLYADVLLRLFNQWWDDPNFSHGFLVPLFSAGVVWHERKRLAAIRGEGAWSGLLVIAAALATLVVGVLGAELFLSRSSLVVLLAGLVIQFRGWRFFRAILFPWAFLFLMIPIPAIVFNQIAFPLQLLASQLASSLLWLLGVPVLREGNVIRLSVMVLEVVEACSGIRSLISLGTLAIIYGYILESRAWPRVLLALGAIPIAVVSNSVRIVGTGLLGQWWDPDKAQGFFHIFSGWVIFVVSLGLLFSFHGTLRWVSRFWAPQRPGQAK